MNFTLANNTSEKCIQKAYLNSLISKNIPIYIYGAGVYSCVVAKYLISLGIEVKSFVVDKIFWKSNWRLLNIKVENIDNFKNLDNKVFINTICNIRPENLLKFEKFPIKPFFIDVPDYLNYGKEFLDKEWVTINKKFLNKTKNILSDELSKITFNKFVERKIAILDANDINFISFGSNYFNSLLPKRSKENYIDIGAFNGDTLKDYINFNKDFENIYLFEGDKKNFKNLKKTYEKLNQNFKNKIQLFNIFLSDKKEDQYLKNSELDLSHQITEARNNSEIKIKTYNLDSFLKDKLSKSFRIKLDVNGHEYKVLIGSSKFIKSKKPLISCKIQTKEDLINIPQYLKSIRGDYNILLRQRTLASLSLVLYAY